MKKSLLKMDAEFRQYWKNYVLQSSLAAFAVFIVLYFLSMQYAVIIASLGATAFIVFADDISVGGWRVHFYHGRYRHGASARLGNRPGSGDDRNNA